MTTRRAWGPASTAPPSDLRSGPSGGKLAAAVAARIVDDVVARGWPVGEVLGSEAELLARYGVSRAVFREAVRLVEHRQAARMRRGPGGGLVVTAPTVRTVTDAVTVYLFSVDARLDAVFEARLALEETVAEVVPARVGPGDAAALRALVEHDGARGGRVPEPRRLHSLLAAMTGNPALELFVDILNRVSTLYLADVALVTREVYATTAHAHARIVEAVLAGDGEAARRRMRSHVLAEADWLRRRRTSRQRLGPIAPRPRVPGDKRAEAVARQVFAEVAAAGWPVGRLLGSETDLVDRYDVSRAVFREAVRLLEYHQIAAMRRGPGGGLVVARPGVAATTDAVALYLDHAGIAPSHLSEVRRAVEVAVAGLAAERVDAAAAARLRGAGAGDDLHAVLASVAANPVLELIAMAVRRPPPADADADARAQQAVVEAVVAGDADQARRQMRRHLDGG